jgi:undecaprenyl-phosphate 4-deoxy-4-formamido-L-arabinose transferase
VRARPRYLVQTILEERNGRPVVDVPRQDIVQGVQASLNIGAPAGQNGQASAQTSSQPGAQS